MTRKTILAAVALTLSLAGVAAARPRPAGHAKAFDANKTFGLGVKLGAPTGLIGKYFLSGDRALDFGVGSIYHYRGRDGLHLYMDYLFHPLSLASNPTFELPLYIGIGGRLWDLNDYGSRYDQVYAFGIRVPIGISFDFNNVPFDLFIQVVPVLDFFSGTYYHSAYVDVDGSFGIRYWFN